MCETHIGSPISSTRHGDFNALFCCLKQSAGNRDWMKFPGQPIILRNIKPYGLYLNAKIFKKTY